MPDTVIVLQADSLEILLQTVARLRIVLHVSREICTRLYKTAGKSFFFGPALDIRTQKRVTIFFITICINLHWVLSWRTQVFWWCLARFVHPGKPHKILFICHVQFFCWFFLKASNFYFVFIMALRGLLKELYKSRGSLDTPDFSLALCPLSCQHQVTSVLHNNNEQKQLQVLCSTTPSVPGFNFFHHAYEKRNTELRPSSLSLVIASVREVSSGKSGGQYSSRLKKFVPLERISLLVSITWNGLKMQCNLFCGDGLHT